MLIFGVRAASIPLSSPTDRHLGSDGPGVLLDCRSSLSSSPVLAYYLYLEIKHYTKKTAAYDIHIKLLRAAKDRFNFNWPAA